MQPALEGYERLGGEVASTGEYEGICWLVIAGLSDRTIVLFSPADKNALDTSNTLGDFADCTLQRIQTA